MCIIIVKCVESHAVGTVIQPDMHVGLIIVVGIDK